MWDQGRSRRTCCGSYAAEDGEILHDGVGDDRQPIETPDVQVGQLWLRVLERRAKLYGLDLERGDGNAMLAERRDDGRHVRLRRPGYEALYGHPYSETIDVEGEEMSDDREALGRGSED